MGNFWYSLLRRKKAYTTSDSVNPLVSLVKRIVKKMGEPASVLPKKIYCSIPFIISTRHIYSFLIPHIHHVAQTILYHTLYRILA